MKCAAIAVTGFESVELILLQKWYSLSAGKSDNFENFDREPEAGASAKREKRGPWKKHREAERGWAWLRRSPADFQEFSREFICLQMHDGWGSGNRRPRCFALLRLRIEVSAGQRNYGICVYLFMAGLALGVENCNFRCSGSQNYSQWWDSVLEPTIWMMQFCKMLIIVTNMSCSTYLKLITMINNFIYDNNNSV